MIDFPVENIRCRHISFKADEFDRELDIAGFGRHRLRGQRPCRRDHLPPLQGLAKLLGGKLGYTARCSTGNTAYKLQIRPVRRYDKARNSIWGFGVPAP